MSETRFYIRRADGKRTPPPSVELLRQMYLIEGMSAKEIARRLGFSKRQIQNQIDRRGLGRGGRLPRKYGPNLVTSGQVISQSFLSGRF